MKPKGPDHLSRPHALHRNRRGGDQGNDSSLPQPSPRRPGSQRPRGAASEHLLRFTVPALSAGGEGVKV